MRDSWVRWGVSAVVLVGGLALTAAIAGVATSAAERPIPGDEALALLAGQVTG